jgi:putative ABC transport system permease protein
MAPRLLDAWFAVRLLLTRPAFAVIAALTLGVAFGAATAMYSVVYAVTIRPLPYPDANQLVQLWQLDDKALQGQFSSPNFDDLQARSRSFSALAIYAQGTAPVVLAGHAQRATVATVSGQFFQTLGVQPALGRGFLDEERVAGGRPVAIVGHRFWSRHLGGRADLAGLSLRLRGASHAVVGVMPAGFEFPTGADIWVPYAAVSRNPYRTGHNWLAIGRLRQDVSLQAAREESNRVAAQLKRELGDGTWMAGVALVPLREQMVGDVRPVLLLLLASVGLLLFVACANLAGLLLVRIASRRREMAIRAALGSSMVTTSVALLAEALTIAIMGGLVGVAFAWWGTRTLLERTTLDIPRLNEVALSWQVLLVALGATLFTGVILGAFSAWRARRSDIAEALKGSARGEAGSAHGGRLRQTLVVAQLAVSMVLLVGAGLLARSLMHLLSQDPGFRTDGVVLVDLSSPSPEPRITDAGLEFDNPAVLPQQAAINAELIDRLSSLPGVAVAGGISRPPLGASYSSGRFVIVRGADRLDVATLQRLAEDPSRTGDAEFRVASAGYFQAMGIPVLRGRLFQSGDTFDAPHVAVISETLARTRWPNEDPIGARIQFGGMDGDFRVFTIVGIVGDIRERGFDADPSPTFYADYRQRPLMTFDFTLVMQAAGDPAALIGASRRMVSEVNPNAALRFRTIESVVDHSVAGRRLALWLTGGFAAAAMLLAVLGVYGVMSQVVVSRRREFGMRMALGAQRRDVYRLLLGQAGRLFAVGAVVGIAAASLLGRLLRSALFGIQPTDPVTYVGVLFLLGVAAYAACAIPAFRATRIDPLVAIRSD